MTVLMCTFRSAHPPRLIFSESINVVCSFKWCDCYDLQTVIFYLTFVIYFIVVDKTFERQPIRAGPVRFQRYKSGRYNKLVVVYEHDMIGIAFSRNAKNYQVKDFVRPSYAPAAAVSVVTLQSEVVVVVVARTDDLCIVSSSLRYQHPYKTIHTFTRPCYVHTITKVY